MAGILARAKARRGLRKALAAVPEAEGLTLSKCLKSTPQTIVYAGMLDDEAVVVKQALGDEAITQVIAQTDELRFQHPRMSDGRFRVPELLISQPEAGIVVMTHAPGERLDQAIKANPGRRSELVASAGAWLAHYAAPRCETDSFGGGYWIKRRSDGMEHLPPGPDRERMAALIGRMRTLRSEFTGRLVTRARSHGDFCPINLLVAGGEIWGVDIQNSNWLALAKDLSRFLVYLEIALPAATHDGPCGLSQGDYDSLLAADGLLPSGEAEMIMPYFLAVEVAGRLVSERRDPFMLSSTRALADRMIQAPI